MQDYNIIYIHFDNEFECTNNRVEGDNGKMNLNSGAANPEFNKAVALLKTHESTARDKYYNAQKINARKPVQKNDVLKREVTYRTYKSVGRGMGIHLKSCKQKIFQTNNLNL